MSDRLLAGTIRLRAALAEALVAADPEWHAALSTSVRLGSAKKGEYGRARLRVDGAPKPVGSAHLGGEQLTVWVVSDVLLRDERLQPDPSADALLRELSRRLGVKLNLVDAPDGMPALRGGFRRHDSWHAGWGLPRPSLQACKAGACMALVVGEGGLDPVRLSALEASGLGERRAEGFGQLRFNDPLLSRAMLGVEASAAGDLPGGVRSAEGETEAYELTDVDRAFLDIVQSAAWREEIARRVLHAAEDPRLRDAVIGKADAKSASRLSGLLTAVKHLGREGGEGFVADWLKHVEKSKGRLKDWGPEGVKRIRHLVDDRGHVWALLQEGEWGEQVCATSQERDRMRSKLWAEAVVALVDACVRKARADKGDE